LSMTHGIFDRRRPTVGIKGIRGHRRGQRPTAIGVGRRDTCRLADVGISISRDRRIAKRIGLRHWARNPVISGGDGGTGERPAAVRVWEIGFYQLAHVVIDFRGQAAQAIARSQFLPGGRVRLLAFGTMETSRRTLLYRSSSVMAFDLSVTRNHALYLKRCRAAAKLRKIL
jgi:hypothetical protein